MGSIEVVKSGLTHMKKDIKHLRMLITNSKREHPPDKHSGNFFEVVKSTAPGQNFLQKHAPLRDKTTATPGEYFGISSQPFLSIGVEILGYCRTETLKRIGRLSNYSWVIPFSFSLSTILKSFKLSPQL